MNETAKKILGYIKRLPETWDGQPLRQQALDNFDENFCKLEYNIINEIDFINYSFNWFTTKEKDYYWSRIYYFIKDGTIQLLPEENKDDISDTSKWSDETKKEFYEFCMNKKGTGYYLDGAIEEFVASKQRNPLFTTEDGKEVFEGDEYWYVWVESEYEIKKHVAVKSTIKEDEYKDFSTEAAAREYVRLNKPMYSLNDFEKAWIAIGKNIDTFWQIAAELEKLKP